MNMNNAANRLQQGAALFCAMVSLMISLSVMSTHADAATRVTVVGLFPGKAVVSIDGKDPRTLSIGEKTGEGVKLISTTSDSATLDIDGKRHTLDVGQIYAAAREGGTGDAARKITLAADGNGHFVTPGQINGTAIQFLVDTGATAVSISSDFARNAGIDYKKGQRLYSQTANGVIVVYKVRLDSVRVGDVTIYEVDGVVIDGDGKNQGLGIALLGMSFLNRMEMKRDGVVMTLTKRF
jgi:aspartyl protease family protein